MASYRSTISIRVRLISGSVTRAAVCQSVLGSVVPEPRIVYTSSAPSHGSSLADLFGLARLACLFPLSAPTAPWAHTDCQQQSAPGGPRVELETRRQQFLRLRET
jgi:hypothetical protein